MTRLPCREFWRWCVSSALPSPHRDIQTSTIPRLPRAFMLNLRPQTHQAPTQQQATTKSCLKTTAPACICSSCIVRTGSYICYTSSCQPSCESSHAASHASLSDAAANAECTGKRSLEQHKQITARQRTRPRLRLLHSTHSYPCQSPAASAPASSA